MKIRESEVYRYLGLKNVQADKQLAQLVALVIEELTDYVTPKHVVERFSCQVRNKEVTVGSLHMSSNDLSSLLSGCEAVFLLAATLGRQADELVRKKSITAMDEAAILQAAQAEMLEQYLDEICQELEAQVSKEGLFLTSRYSPGYGDLSLHHQKELLQCLESSKKIGLTLTDSLMMVPTKSVTAIIGLSPVKKHIQSGCGKDNCEQCRLTNCPYRKSVSIERAAKRLLKENQ